VPTNPGQIALTRISGARARAIDFVKVIRAPFELAYAEDDPMPKRPAMEATFTIAPQPSRFMAA